MRKTGKKILINLLPNTDIDEMPLGRSINWALTIGKTIVFLCFSVIMFGFLYRFGLDQRIEVLQEQVEANIDSIRLLQEEEVLIRKTQAKLDFADELLKQQPSVAWVLRDLENSLPVNSQIEILSLSQFELGFEGKAENEIVFAHVLGALLDQDQFQEIVIDELRAGGVQNPEINFLIRIKLAKDGLE